MDFLASLLTPFTTIDGWTSLIMLMFLEIALGVDNLVFVSITSGRVAPEKAHITRRVGLAAAMIMRCVLLCCVVWIMSINQVLFTLPFGIEESTTPINVRDLVFLIGGGYLIYKGFAEIGEELAMQSDASDDEQNAHVRKIIGVPQAVVTIMFMDIVFSLDSVITAAGLSGQILVMILAVIGAVTLMIVFADPIGDFINNNQEVKLVALLFITAVGVELVLEGFHIEHVAGAEISTLLYAMMIFGFITAFILMIARKRRQKTRQESLNKEQ